tara:strand:+ start:910 stop:1089 length:180 start_codon:yes stop_codon:yes gene_type:complete
MKNNIFSTEKSYENLAPDELVKVTDPQLTNGYVILTKAELDHWLEQSYRAVKSRKAIGV